MSGLDLAAVVGAVTRNCHISDAQYAGDLTLCIFLLKMRELYRWERRIPLSREMPRAEVGDWMNARGQLWDEIETAAYVPVPLGGEEHDPFESRRINAALLPHGLVYSGGYGRHCKPHFFLGELLRHEQRDGFDIYVTGREHARDLEAPPGMLIDRAIFLRTEALRRWLWEKYEEWRWNRKNEAMGRAVACYPFERDAEAALEQMTEMEMESVILHELGEARAGQLLGDAWEALLVDVMRGRAEIMARAVRDLLADCAVTLPGLIARGELAPIHFFFANFVGMRRRLAPELGAAYEAWLADGDRQRLAASVADAQDKWRRAALALLDLHRQLGEKCAEAIEAYLGFEKKLC